MKAHKTRKARQFLTLAGCKIVRRNCGHEIYKNHKGNTFALPANHKMVSQGVMRKLYGFIAR